MATTKKTVTSTPRVDYKIGARVKVTRRRGESKGFTAPLHDDPKTCLRLTKTGPFISVNIGTTKDPDVREFYLGMGGEGDGAKSFKNIKHYKRRLYLFKKFKRSVATLARIYSEPFFA